MPRLPARVLSLSFFFWFVLFRSLSLLEMIRRDKTGGDREGLPFDPFYGGDALSKVVLGGALPLNPEFEFGRT